MPSYTSNFEEATGSARVQPARQAMSASAGIFSLVVGLVLIVAGLECMSPVVLAHLSRTERRVDAELRAAATLRPYTPDGRPTLLIGGNSLLLEGVNMDLLRAGLAPQYEVSRLGIEQTHYLDWYFGLRRLLEEGSRPKTIVLSLATDQLASKFTLGESFAHRQMSTRDFPRVIHEAALDRTTASTYFFAHWSRWLADKGFIRQRIMILLIPNFRELGGRIADHGPHVNDPAILRNMARLRLAELHNISQAYGVRIVLLVPPTRREDYSRDIQEIGDAVGVPVWVPSPPGEFPQQFYRDGFHLNDTGSEVFTARLAQQIRSMPALQANCNACDSHTGTTPSRPNGAPLTSRSAQ
jgi:hypothetical protein